jgi:uncharacterized protein YndB with AHSA1/START domain
VGFDVDSHLGAVERSVSSPERDGQPARGVTVARSYTTTVDDVWDAVTNGERIPRWFLPISGELTLGGRYQLDGNAGGVITTCERTSHLALTWEFAGDISWVEIRTADDGAGRTRLTLTHTARLSEHWGEYGPGAAGVGWEMSLMGLALYLAQPAELKLDEAVFATSPEGKAFITGSSLGWEQAAVAAGTDPDEARRAARRTTAFYTACRGHTRGDLSGPISAATRRSDRSIEKEAIGGWVRARARAWRPSRLAGA